VVQRFNSGSSYEVVEEFNSVKQGYSSVSEYTDKFEDKMANYRKENPKVKEAYYIKCDINGLRGEIKHYMKPLKPAKFNEPGVCKYCGQKWFFGHRCQQYKCLNLMAAEETIESEDEQFHDTSPEEPPDSNTAQTSEDNKLMQISVQAVRGHPANNTFTLPVLIAGKIAIALVDTGSTHTFMDLKFSTKIKCTTTSNTVEKVVVAGGGELLTGAHVHDMPYSIQNKIFNSTFKILPLKGYDIVLGGDWLLTHSLVTFDYEKRQIKIKQDGKNKITLQDNSLHQGVQLMSIDKLEKTLSKGATGYFLFPLSGSENQLTSEHPTISAVLQQFADVFEEPTSLPLERQCDHTIPLKEGAVPPNIWPYRVPLG
jgi:hypothetical protein